MSTPTSAPSPLHAVGSPVQVITTADTSPGFRSRTGRPLDEGERRFFEPSFGHDFSCVRIHTDQRAAGQAALLHARAFTVGKDVFFGQSEFAPRTAKGRNLIAHELAHVIQQGSRPTIQRQAIPTELTTSPDFSLMSDEELQERHDWIVQELSQFTVSSDETALLEEQAGRIGVELGRRRALAAGRTFSDDAIEGMRRYFVRNARNEKDSCIIALNNAMTLVTGEPDLETTPKSIEKTMAKIAASGHSTEAREIRFLTSSGRVTQGGARPQRLEESVWDVVLSMSGGDPGWSVFTMSLLDGFHSVTLTLDASDSSQPHIYWSDQWKSKRGWKEYKRATLDAEVVKLVRGWWDDQAEGKKHHTIVRLWRMRSTPQLISSSP